jgi:HNH endonuclease
MQVFECIDEATKSLEKANAELQPELLTAAARRQLLAAYARIKNLAGFGEATIAAIADDAEEIARVTGTSVVRAKETLTTGKVLSQSDALSEALKHGDVSLDQASQIATAEAAVPGAAEDRLPVAQEASFQVLRERARKTKLEAEQHRGLGERQREARSSRSYRDDLGMVNVHLRMVPSLGTAIVNRAEAEARRLQREAKREERAEPFERHLCDAYAALLSGAGTKARPPCGSPRRDARTRRPEVVFLVSDEVAKRGWKDVREGEFCKIPGVGPVPPEVVKEIAEDALLSAVFYDGKDLRHFVRFGQHIPIEIQIALELGKPPEFDGVKCADCGKRFRPENDHIEPRAADGPTSLGNVDPRCNKCHLTKTEEDRKAGKLKPRTKRPPPDP